MTARAFAFIHTRLNIALVLTLAGAALAVKFCDDHFNDYR